MKIALDEQQYRWHDLRKNPEDLPDDIRQVLTVGEYDFVDETRNRYEVARLVNGWWTNSFIEPFAWREIEPFEEEE